MHATLPLPVRLRTLLLFSDHGGKVSAAAGSDLTVPGPSPVSPGAASAAGRALPFRKVLEYGAGIASGLAAAHEKEIVHRDLKPENIFITREGP